ncbi:hypothetical protein Tco_0367396 [Tanacetum coccineum]
MTRSSTKDLLTPFEEPKRVFHSTRKLFKTMSLDYSSSPDFDLFSNPENQSEEVAEAMREPTMEEYMTITRINYESGNEKGRIELKGRFLIKLRDNAFSETNGEDAIEHTKIFLVIVDSLNIPNIETNGDNTKVKWDPNNIEFENWLASKFRNHKTMDRYTKNALWDYWKRGEDEEEYKDDWIYERNNGIQWVDEKPWTDDGVWTKPLDKIHHECNPLRFKNGTALWPTCNWEEDGILEESMNMMEESSDDEWDHDSPIDEWKDYEHTTYIKTNVSSNQNTYNNITMITLVILGIEVVEQYHSKKLLFDKYCDKMLKRRNSKIINCDVLTQKGPISLKVYKEDWLSEVIENLKVSDLHLVEWREVVQACPDRREKGWKTVYGLIKTRMEYLEQTEKELKIDFNKPLKEQDLLNELNELANKKRRTNNLKDYSSFFSVSSSGPLKIRKYLHFSLCSGIETEEGPWLELQFSLVDNFKLNVVYLLNRS